MTKQQPSQPALPKTSSDTIPGNMQSRQAGPSSGWRAWGLVLALLVGMALGGLAVKLWLANNDAAHRLPTLQQELLLSQAELVQAQAQLDALHGNLAVEESTRKGLEATLLQAQSEVGQLHDQLAFFNQLLPPGPQGAVSIRALDIELAGPNLQYRALLMRNGAATAPFKGQMQFMAHGLQNGKPAKIALRPPQAQGATESADVPPGFLLDFDEFQRSGGLLGVPPDFVAQTVTLNVLEGSTVRVSRTVNLPAQ